MNDIQSKIYKYTDLESIPVMDGYSDLVIEDIPGKSWDVYEKDNALCIASFPYIPGGHPNGLLEHERFAYERAEMFVEVYIQAIRGGG